MAQPPPPCVPGSTPTRLNRTTLLPGRKPADVERAVRWAGACRGRSSKGRRGGSTSSRPTAWACSPTRRVPGRRGSSTDRHHVRTLDGLAVNEWYVESPCGEPGPGADWASDRAAGHGPEPVGRPGETATGRRGEVRRRTRLTGPGPRDDRRAQPGRHCSSKYAPRIGPHCSRSGPHVRAGISVRSAHVATYAGQTLDTFYLTDVRSPACPGTSRAGRPGWSSTPARSERADGETARWTRSAGRNGQQARRTGSRRCAPARPRRATRFSAGGEPRPRLTRRRPGPPVSLAARVTRADSGGMPPAAAPSRSWGRGLG